VPNITVNGSILLPPDMWWENEFSWSPTTSKVEPSITGASIIQVSKRLDGRPITLKSRPDGAFLTRAQMEALHTLNALSPAAVFPVEMGNGVEYTVMFDNSDSKAIEAEAFMPGKEPAPGDYFIATLRLLEVNE
jgi:hypothetical protein